VSVLVMATPSVLVRSCDRTVEPAATTAAAMFTVFVDPAGAGWWSLDPTSRSQAPL
jgi:hypothetical protein